MELELEDPDNIPGLGDEELPHMLLPDSISQLEEFGRHKRPRKAHRGHGRPRLFSDLWVRIGDRWDICYDARLGTSRTLRYVREQIIRSQFIITGHYRIMLVASKSIHLHRWTDLMSIIKLRGIPKIFTLLSYKTKTPSKCSHFRSRNQRFLAILFENYISVWTTRVKKTFTMCIWR